MERATLGQMEKLESALHDSRPLVQEVTMRLGLFANVWAAVRSHNVCTGKLRGALTCTTFQITADIRKLKSRLPYADDHTSPVRTSDPLTNSLPTDAIPLLMQLFIDRVQKLEEMYGYLSQALYHYQVTVWAPIPGTLMP